MEIEQIGAWGELIGGIASLVAAIGVIASLIFVGLQIRQSAAATRGAVRQSISDAHQSWHELSLISPGLVNAREVMNKYPGKIADGRKAWEDWILDHGGFKVFDPLRLSSLYYWRAMENTHFQHETGLLDEDEWMPFCRSMEQSLNYVMHQRFVFESLDERRLLRPNFVKLAKSLITDAPEPMSGIFPRGA